MKQVLVVDDDAMNRDVICKVLHKEGMQSDEAQNGQSAIEMLHQKRYDLIMLDIMMPVLNGFETIAQIRNTMRLSTPIIAISALNTADTIAKAKTLGAEHYLTKPCNIATMLETVKKALGDTRA